jgi:hypothetical protein
MRVKYLLFFSARWVSRYGGIDISLLLQQEELNRILRVLNLAFHFKQYLCYLYNHKVPLVKRHSLIR